MPNDVLAVPAVSLRWDEYSASYRHSSPRWATSDRGWLFVPGVVNSLGNYLDYGPDHYRSGHESCGTVCTCRLSQPGNIHCVAYRGDYGSPLCRYVETVEQAKAWIEANVQGGALMLWQREDGSVREISSLRDELYCEACGSTGAFVDMFREHDTAVAPEKVLVCCGFDRCEAPAAKDVFALHAGVL